MNWIRKKRFYAILLIAFIVFLYMNTGSIGRWLYPIDYRDEIRFYSDKHHVSPYLVAAIMRSESNFSPEIVSAKGAVGLMQVMPSTADWIIVKSGYTHYTVEQLADPKINIDIGTWYLSALYNQFHSSLIGRTKESQIAIIAAAYNAGPGNAMKWVQEGIWDGEKSSVENIPFGETRHYVQRVLNFYTKYERYYDTL